MRSELKTKPIATWKTCSGSESNSPMPGKVHSTLATTAAIASQRHSRARASAKAAAVTTAR